MFRSKSKNYSLDFSILLLKSAKFSKIPSFRKTIGVNVPGASFGGVFRPVSLSPVTKVKDKKNCQNTTKTPA